MTDAAEHLIERTDWPRLLHAHGRAIDTPTHLRALLGHDEKSREACMTHLWSAILHQGTPWTATGPVARIIAAMMPGRLLKDDPLRAPLLKFLASIAEVAEEARSGAINRPDDAAFAELDDLVTAEDDDSIYADEDIANALFVRSLDGCLDALPTILQSMRDGLDDHDPVLRADAAMERR